ncbi:MAG: V-type ATP synthase subunit B [Nitrospinota bacterium]|nr:V-type ATP synthase subunit B [Nitrospinota bacterium]MDH5677422.1 V-type ATP synthase subunit B [Nitrospinota bacterium]MDH5755772.1 V-type ATP synthase subunit B [Nitrospinota bacterium]
MSRSIVTEYQTVDAVKGPLIFVRGIKGISYGELATVTTGPETSMLGQVIEISDKFAALQVFGPTRGISPATARVRFHGEPIEMSLSPLILGRMFKGDGAPMDGAPPLIPAHRRDISGAAINPVRRELPRDFMMTGVSAIDGLNTLARGQKLPIFSGAGLPANELANLIINNAGLAGEGGRFALVFAGMGITGREADYFYNSFHQSGAIERSVVFLNLAGDPVIERFITPRLALTAAEYLAFDLDFHVLVALTDMTNYCNALREISSAREEIPGRRGYPGYMYTDLAGLYERAGRIKGKPGSITQIPILTMPDDDITHPIADLTGYITEGQIVLDRDLNRKGIFPPINALPSLSRLMDHAIGADSTREDHRQLADQLYMLYARGVEQRRVASIIGEEGLTEADRGFVRFADRFEKDFIHQGESRRDLEQTLAAGWALLEGMEDRDLVRVSREMINKYRPERGDDGLDEDKQT